LDILDVRIFRELNQDKGSSPLQSDIRQSFRRVAGKLEIDEGTVRHRVAKLKESGFMKPWYVFPNPQIFGLRVAHARFVVHPPVQPTTKEEAMRKINLVPGVWVLVNHFGGSMRVVLYFEDEASLRNQLELIAAISNSDQTLWREIHFPSCAARLSNDDLAVVKSIQKDPTKSYALVSKETGLSSKTVKRRLERMLEGKALFVISGLNPASLRGAMLVELLVLCKSPGAMREAQVQIAAKMGEYLAWAQLADDDHMLFLLLLTSTSQIKMILNWVTHQPSVVRAFMDLVEERIEQYDAFNRELDRKIVQMRSASGERLQPARTGYRRTTRARLDQWSVAR
jgi:DNA-binding Lrp family transcriptional regulator